MRPATLSPSRTRCRQHTAPLRPTGPLRTWSRVPSRTRRSLQGHTRYNDANHEIRVYAGWTGSAATGPVEIFRGYMPTPLITASVPAAPAGQQTVYQEVLTESPSGAIHLGPDGLPDGGEPVGTIQSLSRDLTNNSGQVIETDDYFSLAGVTYSQPVAQLGSASNNSSSGNFHATTFAYDEIGLQNRVQMPTGTIYRTVFDTLGEPVSHWVGTSDNPANSSFDWGPTDNGGNMVDVQDVAYDAQNAPGAPSLSQTAGGSLPQSTYFVTVTYVTPTGETAASVESQFAVSAADVLVVASPPAANGATGYNVYVSTSSGTEVLQNTSPISIGAAWQEPTTGLLAGTQIEPLDGMGDGNLTRTVDHPGASDADRVNQYLYDFRDRRVAEKDGVQPTEDTNTHRPIFYWTWDNQDALTGSYQYDGDQVNLSDFASAAATDAPPTADPSRLRAKTLLNRDDQGRVYEQSVFSVDRISGTPSTNSLNTFDWYDQNGNLIKALSPGGLVQKWAYDAANRQTTAYTTDGGGDGTPLQTNSYQGAAGVAGNIVLEQVETQFDSDGNAIFTADRQRFHDDSPSATGALGTPTTGNLARVYYSADYYDLANRLTDFVDFGTNQANALNAPPSLGNLPAGSLHTAYAYDAAGNVSTITDPRGIQSLYSYDLLHRLTQSIQGHTNGSPAPSIDQTTSFAYDGEDHMLTQTAVVPGSVSQITRWVYGITPNGGYSISSNDLLKNLQYPDPTTGLPSSAAANSCVFGYNDLGDRANLYYDSNQTFHTYSYDVLERLTLHSVVGFSHSVDYSVRSLAYAYDTNGQLSTASSYNSSNGTGTLLNQVEEQYNGLGQRTGEWQSHSGAVNTNNPPQVQYVYQGLTGASSDGRITAMIYPNQRQLDFVYNSGLDGNISRISALSDHAGTGAGTLESYGYLGLDTIVQRNRPDGVNLTYARLNSGEGTGDGGDQYIGLDRFGRIADQRWTTSGGAATDRFQQGYDADGNVLFKNNLVSPINSELYHANGSGNGYDALNRLVAERDDRSRAMGGQPKVLGRGDSAR